MVSVSTEAAEVVVEAGGEDYSPDVMNDICARAVSVTLEVHRQFAALEVE